MMRGKYNGPVAQAKVLAAWPVALRLQQFSYQQISSEMTCSMELATFIVRGWLAAGNVRVISPGRKGGSGRMIFEVAPAQEIRIAPVPGDAVEQMWTAMRKIGAFSPVDLGATCAPAISSGEAAAYCRMLLAAGYLRVVQKAVPPAKPAIYRLMNETGIRAPRLRRLACIVDPNRGTTLPLTEFRA